MARLKNEQTSGLGRARSFNTVAAVLVIGALAVVVAWTVDRHAQAWITQRVAMRAVTRLDELLPSQITTSDLTSTAAGQLPPLASMLERHLEQARAADNHDLLQVNIYALDGTVLFSGQQERIGRKVLPSRVPRLAGALAGTVNTRLLALSPDDADLTGSHGEVLAVYAPILRDERVIAASEVYVDPLPIRLGRLVTWLGVVGPVTFGLLLYVRRRQTEQAVQVEQLIGAAFFDALTGLANRSLFNFRLHQAFHRARRRGELMVVMFMDLDRFKSINDTLGHAAGDQLLVSVGERLQTTVRPEDTIARLGGDEFAVILEEIPSIHDAGTVARRILEAMRQPFVLAGQERSVRVSIGIAARVAGHTKPDDVVHDADVALYRAKEGGRDRFAIFTADAAETQATRGTASSYDKAS